MIVHEDEGTVEVDVLETECSVAHVDGLIPVLLVFILLIGSAIITLHPWGGIGPGSIGVPGVAGVINAFHVGLLGSGESFVRHASLSTVGENLGDGGVVLPILLQTVHHAVVSAFVTCIVTTHFIDGDEFVGTDVS